MAASSRGKAITLARAKAEGDAKALRHSAQEEEATEVSEARLVSWRRGKKTPTLGAHAPETVRRRRGNMAARVQRRSAEAFASAVKHSVPRSTPRSPRLRGVSTQRKSRSEPGTHEVRVHVNRSGGRSRSDASRVLFPGRSQGLLENQGASQKEARKHRLTRGTSREKAKRCAEKRSQLKQYALVRLVGFGSQALDTTEGVLGLSPVLPSRA